MASESPFASHWTSLCRMDRGLVTEEGPGDAVVLTVALQVVPEAIGILEVAIEMDILEEEHHLEVEPFSFGLPVHLYIFIC